MSFIPYPKGLTFEEWSAIVVEEFAQQGMPQWVVPEMQWREWGDRIQEVDELTDLPYQADYENWEDWAERFVEAYY